MTSNIFSILFKKSLPVIATIVFITFIYKVYGAWEYTAKNLPEFFKLTYEHLLIVVITMFFSISIGVTLGTIMTRKGWERVSPVIMAVVNVWQAVPSLGVIALSYGLLPLIGLSGIGLVPALIAVFTFSVAPVVRNTYAGIDAVSSDMKEAAVGMGMTKKQILFQVELPNALPVIMGGVRTSTALVVGTAPLAFLIGGGGLGFWIFTGIALVDMGIMVAGAVPVALLAMLFDYLLEIGEKFVVSNGVQVDDAQMAAL
jgi:osmoprotectant transport system permease protein